MDHPEAGTAMRSRGRGWLALALAALALFGAAATVRLGAAVPAAVEQGVALSSAWLCPHGGGDGWLGTIAIANPGDAPIQARLVSYGARQPASVGTIEVPAHGEALSDVPATVRAASTLVEIFGGWAAVGWNVRAGGGEAGMGAEPCTPRAGDQWSVVDGVTSQDMHSSLVVMNPFAADAVIDVVLFLPDKPAVRPADWTDLRVPAGRSISLDLKRALGESIVGVQVIATRGRIAVGSLAVRIGGGVRSALAAPAYASRWILPVVGGTGGGTLSLLVPGQLGIRFGATQLSEDSAPQTAGNLTVIRQGGASTVSAPVTTSGASAVIVQVIGEGVVGAGFREAGPGLDDAATGGVADPGPAWIVLPTALGGAAQPSLVLVNSGSEPVTATLSLLTEAGGATTQSVSVNVAAGRTASAPIAFLRRDPTASVLVRAEGDLVALGAGTSGPGQTGWYALALGVPVPTTAMPMVP